jgi:hypothetical protein
MDPELSRQPSPKCPEFEDAAARLAFTLVQDLMIDGDSLLGGIQREKVDHLSSGADVGDAAGGHVHPIEVRLSFTLTKAAIQNGDLGAWAAMIHEAAMASRESMATQFFAAVDESCRRVGNVVDARGRPFGWDILDEMLDVVDLDFDEEGEPKLQTFVGNPSLVERIARLPPRTAEEESRYRAILLKKKAAFDARRRVRKLG